MNKKHSKSLYLREIAFSIENIYLSTLDGTVKKYRNAFDYSWVTTKAPLYQSRPKMKKYFSFKFTQKLTSDSYNLKVLIAFSEPETNPISRSMFAVH